MRIGFALLVVVAALGLSGCGLLGASVGGSESGTYTVTGGTGEFTAVCSAELLSADGPAAAQGTPQGLVVTIPFKNSGGSCAAAGTPAVKLIGSDGAVLAHQPRSESGPPVLLDEGEKATLSLLWRNWCGADPGEVTIEITFDDQSGAGVPLPAGTPECVAKGSPTELDVKPFAAG